MSFHPHKKEEDTRFSKQMDEDQIERSDQNEKLPEFDEMGTPLNAI